MLKTTTPKKSGHARKGPSEQTIQRLLNYSKSIRVIDMPGNKKEIINPN
ncbi:MAG: hypothetical protein JJU02_10860 [Cryomorphaceae bacterium]|nr:hypothetical protein [Cryomorphaceae bacterium]